jgi:thioredoxin reductase
LLTIVEKRAAFECPPHLVRPSMYVHEGVWACGDYVAGPYPSTLEAAVRSGEQAMAFLNNSLIDENNT